MGNLIWVQNYKRCRNAEKLDLEMWKKRGKKQKRLLRRRRTLPLSAKQSETGKMMAATISLPKPVNNPRGFSGPRYAASIEVYPCRNMHLSFDKTTPFCLDCEQQRPAAFIPFHAASGLATVFQKLQTKEGPVSSANMPPAPVTMCRLHGDPERNSAQISFFLELPDSFATCRRRQADSARMSRIFPFARRNLTFLDLFSICPATKVVARTHCNMSKRRHPRPRYWLLPIQVIPLGLLPQTATITVVREGLP